MNARPAAISARAATISQKGRCDAQRRADVPARRAATGTRRAACARTRSTGTQPPEVAKAVGKDARRRGRAEDDRPAEILRSLGRRCSAAALKKVVKANETLSFEAREGETLAIVGESGCGKSTFAKVLMGLETATSGKIMLYDQDIQSTPIEKRGTDTVSSVQMVFQNPFDTLNPSMTVGRQIIRALEIFGEGKNDAERRDRMLELLDLVKLPRAFADRMPRQLSGGQKQRVGIARAFAGGAKIVVADEPVSALDVSVQAAVTDLLMEIQRKNRTTLLFISHDLSIVRYLSDRVMVMYLGHVVEMGTTDQVFQPPYHPYTEALLSAVPIADTRVIKKRIVLEGDIPSAMNPPPGCPFQTRCRWK